MAENQLPDIESLRQRRNELAKMNAELETQRRYEVKCADAAQNAGNMELMRRHDEQIGRINRETRQINKELDRIFDTIAEAQRINSTMLNNESKIEDANSYSNPISQAPKGYQITPEDLGKDIAGYASINSASQNIDSSTLLNKDVAGSAPINPAPQNIDPSTLFNKDSTPPGDGGGSNSAPAQLSPDYPSDR